MRDNRIRRRGWRALVCALIAGLLATACSSAKTTSAPSSQPAHQLYTPPAPGLVAAAAKDRAQGNESAAAVLMDIARTPQAVWDTGQAGEAQRIHAVVIAAARERKIPVVVVYNLPFRDSCGKFSATSAITAAQYMSWVNQLAAAGSVDGSPVIWIVEPDGLADTVRDCGLSAAQITQRYALLRYDMQKLSSLRGAQVYEDAGNPGEFTNPDVLAGPLRQTGVAYGEGISANVSNFQYTNVVVTWVQALVQQLGPKFRAVIDTSRNGNGPYTGPQQPTWCNPPGRALGPVPQADPVQGVAWYLWVKNDGYSDGACNGGPPAGGFDPSLAANLVENTHSQV